MKTKMKGKGKAITGIALAAIMLASVFAAMVPTASAQTGNVNQDIEGYINVSANAGDSVKVLKGETLNFSKSGCTIFGYSETVHGSTRGSTSTDYDTGAEFSEADTEYSWFVDVFTGDADVVDSGYNSTYDVILSLEKPRMELELKAESGGVAKKVEHITQGTQLITEFSTNLFGDDIVDLIINGPDGRMHTDAQYRTPLQDFDELNVTHLKASYGTTGINTTDWKVGTYTFEIKTKYHLSRGLEDETTQKTLTIGKPAIDIKADKTSVIELEVVKLTVTGKVGNTIVISGPVGDLHVSFPTSVDDNEPYYPANGTMESLKIDADGTRVFSVIFNETGSYTITVTDDNTTATDTVDITVSEKGVTFDLPMTVVIGQKLIIRGTANSGTKVDVYVDGKLYNKLNDLIIEDGEFSEEVTVDTNIGMGVPGTVRLKAWIDSNLPGTVNGNPTTPPTSSDGEAAFLLTEPGLTAEISVTIVAQEDSFYVTGTAKGAKRVDIITVAPKGPSGDGMESVLPDLPGITLKQPSVSEIDDTFSQKIPVDGDADTGTYLVGVFSPGRDGYYGTNVSAKRLLTAIAEYGDLRGKTQEQLVAMITDLTTQAGSDDLSWIGAIKVEAAKVELDSIADVALGAPLEVSGTTNREEGHIMLITVKGPVELAPEVALVENGVFNATFDTTDAQVGTYTVQVDDGDGHTDDAIVEILEKVVTVATPTPTATPTAAPTAVPTAVATAEPTPIATEEPGFEAVFAIAGLLSIAYLVLRRKK